MLYLNVFCIGVFYVIIVSFKFIGERRFLFIHLLVKCDFDAKLMIQVLCEQGYSGAAADIWSCGVILYVILAGHLPFEETDLPSLYKKVQLPSKVHLQFLNGHCIFCPFCPFCQWRLIIF